MAGRQRTDSLRPRRRSRAPLAGALLLAAALLLTGAQPHRKTPASLGAVKSVAAVSMPTASVAPFTSAVPPASALPSASAAPPTSIAPFASAVPVEAAYVLNANSRRFHRPECSSLRDMKPDNRLDFSGSREEVLDMGYTPCKRCNP